ASVNVPYDLLALISVCLPPLALWPLMQRALTDEPSVAAEAGEWRPRPVAPELWVAAPLVFVTLFEWRIGSLKVDPPNLVIPLACWLAWRFGLRGWRPAVLMVLPALLWFKPLDWMSPVSLDVAATALLAAALFARPSLLTRLRMARKMPWAG